jgi:hypothetical protein
MRDAGVKPPDSKEALNAREHVINSLAHET